MLRLPCIVGLPVGVVVHPLREKIIRRIRIEKKNATAQRRIGVVQNVTMMMMIGTIIEAAPDDIMIMRILIEEEGPNKLIVIMMIEGVGPN